MFGKLITKKLENVIKSRMCMIGELSFMKKDNRDLKVKELIESGYIVVKDSICNQNVHPQYIKDYPYPYQTGFGNTDYNTFFSVIYHVRYYSYKEKTIEY